MEHLPLITAVASVATSILLVILLIKLSSSRTASPLGFTAKELGAELSGAIDAAFKAHVPNPEKFAAANANAVEQAAKKAAEAVEALHKNLLQAQSSAADKWMAGEKNVLQGLEQTAKSIEAAANKLQEALNHHLQQLEKHLQQYEKIDQSAREQWKTITAQQSEQWKSISSQHADQLKQLTAQQGDQLKQLLNQHAEALAKSSAAIAAQLEKIMQLEKDIQQVLHIQQVVDGSIKAVSSAEEFKATLAALRHHLEQSDALLKELSRPRTIRLIEQEA